MSRSPPEVTAASAPAGDCPPTRADIERALAAVPAAAFVCDNDGRITAFNAHAARLWGREPRIGDDADRFCGAPRLYTPNGARVEHAECWMAQALTEASDCEGVPVIVEQPGGRCLETIAHAKVLRDADGCISGAFGIQVDMSGVQRDAQRKDEFLAMLGHDLRNPLGPIRNAMHILRARGGDERALWAIELVERQVDELVTVIDAASDVSRISRGLVKPAYAPFVVADAVREAIDATAPILGRRQQTCRLEMPGEPQEAHGDRKRVSQAVATMLRCVSRALPSGSQMAMSVALRDRRWTICAGPAGQSQDVDRNAEVAHTPPASVGLMLLRALASLLGATMTVRPVGADGYQYEMALP